MPRAVIAADFGGPEVIRVVEVPSAPPGPGEVVVEVRVAALNPVDAKVAAGVYGKDPATLPRRLGNEAAGVVVAVGSEGLTGGDGEAIAVGDEVIVYRVAGGLAEELTVPADAVLQKPASLGFPEAAGLLLVGVTAEHALTAARVGAGDVVLVHGAAGSVGHAAVQLAVARGARVIGTAAAHRHEELRGLGAEPVEYGEGLLGRVQALTDRVDAAIDTVGTQEALDVSLALVADRARIVTIANGPAVQAAGGTAIGGGPGADPGTKLRAAARAGLVRLAGSGGLVIPVTREFPLEQAAAAFAFLAEGHAGGKVVLLP